MRLLHYFSLKWTQNIQFNNDSLHGCFSFRLPLIYGRRQYERIVVLINKIETKIEIACYAQYYPESFFYWK